MLTKLNFVSSIISIKKNLLSQISRLSVWKQSSLSLGEDGSRQAGCRATGGPGLWASGQSAGPVGHQRYVVFASRHRGIWAQGQEPSEPWATLGLAEHGARSPSVEQIGGRVGAWFLSPVFQDLQTKSGSHRGLPLNRTPRKRRWATCEGPGRQGRRRMG